MTRVVNYYSIFKATGKYTPLKTHERRLLTKQIIENEYKVYRTNKGLKRYVRVNQDISVQKMVRREKEIYRSAKVTFDYDKLASHVKKSMHHAIELGKEGSSFEGVHGLDLENATRVNIITESDDEIELMVSAEYDLRKWHEISFESVIKYNKKSGQYFVSHSRVRGRDSSGFQRALADYV